MRERKKQTTNLSNKTFGQHRIKWQGGQNKHQEIRIYYKAMLY